MILTPAACSDLMQLLDQKLQLLGSVQILAVGLTWQRSWTRREATPWVDSLDWERTGGASAGQWLALVLH